LNSFSFEEKDPIFARLKPGLALRLVSKGLFYIRAMVCNTFHDNASHLRIPVEGFKGDLIESQNLNLISLDITKKTKAGL
jgi:hypothetical protein